MRWGEATAFGRSHTKCLSFSFNIWDISLSSILFPCACLANLHVPCATYLVWGQEGELPMNLLHTLNKTFERGKKYYSDDGELYRGNYSTYIPLEYLLSNALIPNPYWLEASPCHFNVFVLLCHNNEIFIYVIQSSGLLFYSWTYVIFNLSVLVLHLCWVHCFPRA